jgi:Zn-dependent membrane protease YugP
LRRRTALLSFAGMYGYDPTYLFYLLPGMLLAALAQWYVKSTVRRYMDEPTSGGRSGAQVAAQLLRAAGIHDVGVERHEGFLSDHYDPGARVVRLSPDVYEGTSIAAAGIAAHEVGHVIQHAVGYPLMSLRQSLVGPARFGSQLSYFVVMAGILLHVAGLAWFGVLLFGAVFAFELVTVPVEINASRRAGAKLRELGLVTAGEAEGVSAVLRAAAFTYIAAMVTTLLQLLYFISRVQREERR